MRRTHFKKIFGLEVFHSYFEQQVCSCLQFIPGVSTRKLQKQFGFTMRNNINGFAMYADTQQPLADYLHYISRTTGETGFDFDIGTKDDAFHTFTELPVDWLGQIVYDSRVNAGITDTGMVQLTEELSESTSGYCTGKLSVHFDEILKYQDPQGYASFCLRFNARVTQWQYFVINKSRVQLTNPLVNGNDEIGFEDPQPVTTQSGEQALLFSSGENLIPLSEVPRYRFNLINNGVADDTSRKKSPVKVIFKGLPSPGPERTGIVNINGQKRLSSPMYVYV